MKIFIHTMYFLPEFGSAPILMNELASSLAARGHEVEVVTTIPRPPHNRPFRWRLFASEDANGFRIKRFRTNFTVHHIGRLIAWTIYMGWALLNLRNVRKGDVLFLRMPPLQLGIVGFAARRWKHARVVLSVQDIHPDLSIESGLLRNPAAIRLAQRFERWIYRSADDIVVISEGFRQNLEEKQVASDKLHIVPNWVDTEFLRPLPQSSVLVQKLGLWGKFIVMYSGTITLSSYLTLEKVLEAAKVLKGDGGVKFVIVGEGLKKPELVKKAEELGLENVTFLPFLPYEDLPALLAASDILLVPLDREKTQLSVPSKLYNYMAAGRAILGMADSDSEVARIIEEAQCGVSVEPEDVKGIAEKILELKDSVDDRAYFGSNARRYCVKNYAREHIVGLYEKLMLGDMGKEE